MNSVELINRECKNDPSGLALVRNWFADFEIKVIYQMVMIHHTIHFFRLHNRKMCMFCNIPRNDCLPLFTC